MADSDNTLHAASAVIAQLSETIKQRRQADPAESYVAALFAKGDDAVLQKVGEEAVEMILAMKSNDQQAIENEAADLLFHTMVALELQNSSLDNVLEILAQRFGVSGHTEKALRNTAKSS